MQKINLRDLYPDVYKTDVFVDVAEEVLAAIRGQQQDAAVYERRKFRHKAHYSLNREDGIENDAEGADRRCVWDSIQCGLKKLARLLDNVR